MQIAAAVVAVLLPALIVLRQAALADRPVRARPMGVDRSSVVVRPSAPPAPSVAARPGSPLPRPSPPGASAPVRAEAARDAPVRAESVRDAPAPVESGPDARVRAETVRDAPTSVLSAFRGTEFDRGPRAGRRAMSALLLALVTLSIATTVAGVIYLGLRRLG